MYSKVQWNDMLSSPNYENLGISAVLPRIPCMEEARHHMEKLLKKFIGAVRNTS